MDVTRSLNWGRYILEAVTIVVAAVICALVANALAPRDRKLVVVSQYSAPQRAAAPAQTTNAAITAPAATTATIPAAPTTRRSDNPPTATAAQPAKRPAKTPPPASHEPAAATKTFAPHPDKPYVEIAYAEVVALHDKGALFLDARRTSVYEEGHIPGARPFSVWESDIDQKVNGLFNERSDPRAQNEPIVVYCSGGDCEDSHMLAQKLFGAGFENVLVYKDGWPDWVKRGGPSHTGPQP